MKTMQVVRTHHSPYHQSNFEQNEGDKLELLAGVKYVPLNKADLKTPTILITNTHTKLAELPPGLLRSTELILHSNSGYDHFAKEIELWKNIPVIVGHCIRAQAVAEYSISCLYEGLIELPQHLMWNADRKWNRPLLKDQEVWIFGFGHIGKIVASTLHALGVKIKIVDPFVSDCPYPQMKKWQEGRLSNARAVIVCCSLNSTSAHLFNQDFFDQAHPELLFINGARGNLVDENALKGFLLGHPQAFAFLDVFEKEPFESNWHSFPQVWKTSHIAGVYGTLDEGIIEFEYQTLKDYLELGKTDFNSKYHKELLQNKWIQGELI